MQAGGPEELTFVGLKNVKLSDAKLPPNMSMTFAADVLLENPNPFGVEVAKLDFDVSVDSKKATHVSQNSAVKIPANSEFSMPLQFRIPLKEKEVFKNLKDVFSGAWKKQALDIRTEGAIYVNALGTPIKIPFTHEESYKLSDYLK